MSQLLKVKVLGAIRFWVKTIHWRDVASMGPAYTLGLCLHSQASWKLFESVGYTLVLGQGSRHTCMTRDILCATVRDLGWMSLNVEMYLGADCK